MKTKIKIKSLAARKIFLKTLWQTCSLSQISRYLKNKHFMFLTTFSRFPANIFLISTVKILKEGAWALLASFYIRSFSKGKALEKIHMRFFFFYFWFNFIDFFDCLKRFLGLCCAFPNLIPTVQNLFGQPCIIHSPDVIYSSHLIINDELFDTQAFAR